MKKIVVLSYTGKVGKSTICNNLLIPRLPDAFYAEIESINESGENDAKSKIKIKGRKLDVLQNIIYSHDCVVVDVGASNVEAFMLELNQSADSHTDFDCFIVPIEANYRNSQGMKEAIKTIESLSLLGVEKERIKVIFNKLPPDSTVNDEVNPIIKYHDEKNNFTLNPKAVLTSSGTFNALEIINKTYLQMLNDTSDYRQILRETPMEEEEKRIGIVKLMRAQRGVKAIQEEFDSVFSELFGE